MTQVFDEAGKVIPVTVVEAGPCYVVQKKTEAADGYNAIQLGFKSLAAGKLNKPRQGHLAKVELKPLRHLKEFRVADPPFMSWDRKLKLICSPRVNGLMLPVFLKEKGLPGGSSNVMVCVWVRLHMVPIFIGGEQEL